MRKVLIAYATKTGSTKEVAQKIAEVLGARGITVELREASGSARLEPGAWDGVIVGAPINGMRWLDEATRFVEANKSALAATKTAYFLLSVALAGKGAFASKVKSRLDPVSAVVQPVMKGFFGGVMSAEPPLILRLLFGLSKDTPKDARDWKAIEAWAKEFASKLA